MPEVGDVGRGRDLGKTPERAWFRWEPCSLCNKPRWARFRVRDNKAIYAVCGFCANKGERNHSWKGGRMVTKEGYVKVRITSKDPLAPMAYADFSIMQHRLVMARHLGRRLQTEETVHHINGKRDDNRIENLELLNNEEHVALHRHEDSENGIDPFHGMGFRRKYN